MMIHLELVSTLDVSQLGPYDDEYDNETSVLHDICSEFHKNKLNQFRIQAFEANFWHVDVGTDLCTMLDELPECIAAIKSGRNGSLDFCEQGTQRTMFFDFYQGEYICYGKSYLNNWTPKYQERLSQPELLKMLETVLNTFLAALTSFHSNRYLVKWLGDV